MRARSLIGRDREIGVLRAARATAAEGSGGLLLVTGEPGIGKTALVHEAVADPALTVLWGTCREGTGTPGLWAWAEVLRSGRSAGLEVAGPDGLGVDVARLDLPPSSAQTVVSRATIASAAVPDRFASFDAVGRLLRGWADHRPLVVVVDDLQFADAGTVRLLAFLAADLPRSRLLVIGISRTPLDAEPDVASEVAAVLGQLLARSDQLRVGPLTESEAAELIGRFLGTTDETALGTTYRPAGGAAGITDLAQLYRLSGGNAFFLLQLAIAGPTGGVPEGVRATVRRRLSALSPTAREVLDVAAVVGRQVSFDVLAASADTSREQVSRAVRDAVTAGILEPRHGPRVVFVHDLFRETIVADLDEVSRAGLHARIGDTLATASESGTPGLAADLCRHRAAAALLGFGDPAAVLPVVRQAAGQASARGAHEEAAAHLRDGVTLASTAGQPSVRRAMLLDLAAAHARAGDLAMSRQRYDQAAADCRTAGDGEGLAAAALGLHRIGLPTWSDADHLTALIEEALAARGQLADATSAQLLAALAQTLTHTAGDAARAEQVSRRAVKVARQAGDPQALARCLLAVHDSAWTPGGAGRRLDIVAEMRAAAEAAGDAELSWQARFCRFAALLERADPLALAEFEALAGAQLTRAEPHYRWVIDSRRVVLAQLAGRLDEAESLILAVAELGVRLGEPEAFNVAGELQLHQAALRGRLDDAQLPISQVPALVRAQVESRAALDRGDGETALAVLRPWVDTALHRSRNWQLLGHAALVAEVGATAGDPDLIAAAADVLRPAAGGFVVTGGAISILGPVDLYLALCSASTGDRTTAMRQLDSALDASRRLGAVGWVGCCEVATALLLSDGSAQERVQAEQLAAAAARTADAVGFSALSARAQRVLSRLHRPENSLQRTAGIWTISYDGVVVQLPDAKGLTDIARLLASPGRDIPARQLIGEAAVTAARLGADPVLDEPARHAYRRRLAELEDAATRADARGDVDLSRHIEAERRDLLGALRAAQGLGGRPRRLGDLDERARKTVTARIRDSIRKVEQQHPALGRHLRLSIETGGACAYRPTEPTRWTVDLGSGQALPR